MGQYPSERIAKFYAETYDACVHDWPGELDFYQGLAARPDLGGRGILELACGTGRVALRLARAGHRVDGLDMSGPMLEVARGKCAGIETVRWIEGDMRSFDFDQTYGLVIIPGHSFQNLLASGDQAACFECARRHLAPEGRFVVHLDHPEVDWLGGLAGAKGGVLEPAGEFTHPKTGATIRTSQAWSYEPVSQTAVLQTVWEQLGPEGEVVDRWDTGPIRIHCVFRFEMEHLLARTGFRAEAVYGDFFGGELTDGSSEMVWVAQVAALPEGETPSSS
jgi:SAM-dependent methyltransferase